MIINRELNAIYETLYEGNPLITRNLVQKGLSSFRAQRLAAAGVLSVATIGHYELVDREGYEEYARARNSKSESIIVISSVEQTVLNVYLLNGTITNKLLVVAGLSYDKINNLLKDGFIKKNPSDSNCYLLNDDELLIAYKRETERNPSLLGEKSAFSDRYAEIVFKILEDEGTLTKKSLLKSGISKEEIDQMIVGNYLVALSDEHYSLTNMYSFILFAKGLKSEGKLEEANRCFEVCYNSDTRRSALDSIIQNLLLEDMVLVASNIERFRDLNGTPYIKEYNFYLFLLSFVTSLSSEQRKKVFSMTAEDVVLSKENAEIIYGNAELINQVRTHIIKLQFKKALALLDDESIVFSCNSELFVLKRLLSRIIAVREDFKSFLKHAISTRQVGLAGSIIAREMQTHKLESVYKVYHTIANDILRMRDTRTAIEPEAEKTSTLMGFIKAKNYRQAHLLALEEGEKKKIPENQNMLGILLQIAEQTVALYSTRPFHMINLIKDAFERGNMDRGRSLLDRYLQEHDLSSYKYLFDKLYQLKAKSKEDDFTELFDMLIEVVSGSFVVDVDKYLNAYLDALADGEFEIANLYIGIVRNAISHHHTVVDEQQLMDTLKEMRGLYAEEAHKNMTIKPVKNGEDKKGDS